MRQIFLDTETTGLSPESGDRIIEIGCVEIVNRRLTGRKVHFYVNPERRNSIDAYKVHGLSDEFLADKPLFGHIVDELIEFVRDAEIIIHNAAFDIGFLDAELRRIGRPAFLEHGVRVTDTPVDGARQLPGQVELARCPVQALRGQQHRARAARRVARRGAARRGLHPHDARPGLAGHRCRRPVGCRAGGAADRLQHAHARRHRRPTKTTSPAMRRCSRRSTRRAADALSGASRQRCRTCSPWHNDAPSAGGRSRPARAVSSGVEHVLHTDGVGGSKPSPPTTISRPGVNFSGTRAPSAPTCRPP